MMNELLLMTSPVNTVLNCGPASGRKLHLLHKPVYGATRRGKVIRYKLKYHKGDQDHGLVEWNPN